MQALLHVLLTVHRPEHELALVRHDRLPGESDAAAAARWRQVMVRRRGLLFLFFGGPMPGLGLRSG